SFSLKLASQRLFLSRFAALQGLRRLQVLLKRRQRVLGEARHIVAALGLLLELFDFLLVVGHDVLGEFLVKGLAVKLRQPIVLLFRLRLRFRRRSHALRLGERCRLLVGGRVILDEHLTERAHAVAAGVRSFGQMLVQDHSAANEKATSLAQTQGVTPPTEPKPKAKQEYDRLSKLNGQAFDEKFAKHIVADHKKDIKEFEKQAKGSDDVANFAKDTLPTLKKHLRTAQSLESGKSAQK